MSEEKVVSEEKVISEEGNVSVLEDTETREVVDPEAQAFYDFLLGNSDAVPPNINKVMNNVITKLSIAAGVSTIKSIKRIDKLNQFLSTIEEQLCDVENFELMENKDKMALYSSLKATASDLSENTRRFIAMSKDTLVVDSAASKMTSKILALSDKDLGILAELIELTKGTGSLEQVVKELKDRKEAANVPEEDLGELDV